MDHTDESILHVLKENGRATVSEISKRVNLSIPAVSERIKKLEESQMIEQYTIRMSRAQRGYKLLAMVFVNIERTACIQMFRERIVQFEEVLECHHMAGEYDYMLKVLTKDTSELEDFLSNKLKRIEGIQNSNTLIVLSTLKEGTNR